MNIKEEMQELVFLVQEENMMNLNREMTNHLRKIGIKLREFKWDELEAS